MEKLKHNFKFVLCIENRDCEDLKIGKVYPIIADNAGAQENFLRVVDESMEDYLYPASYFILLELPKKAHFIP
jgi:hypothetical protein